MKNQGNDNATKTTGIVPKGTPEEVYSKDPDYIRVTQHPESYRSYREFLLTLNRFVWVLSLDKQNALLRRAQMAHNMDTTLTRNPFFDEDAIEQHAPDMPDWF